MKLEYNFKHNKFWSELITYKKLLIKQSIAQLFIADQNRFKNFSINLNEIGLLYDFSKQHLDQTALNLLYNAAHNFAIEDRIKDLFRGEKINLTEKKAVGHIRLRYQSVTKDNLWLNHSEIFSQNIYKNCISDIICLGIGGSYLGPKMICHALEDYIIPSAKKINFHFIANYDLQTLSKTVAKLSPKNSVVIISSKSFTTAETINNANFFKAWLNQADNSTDGSKIFAVTSNYTKAIEFGIKPQNIFCCDDDVGGRYSVWSIMSLAVILKLGISNFKKLLTGAAWIDQNFQDTPLSQNLPITMALISIWNINFLKYNSLAVIPYLDSLEFLPEYLQQLCMESNGKSINLANKKLNYHTAEIIFGGTGCNVQHSFMQLLHQGRSIIPVDFIVTASQKFLFANCLAQSQALMLGTNNLNLEQKLCSNLIPPFKYCGGNRPSSTILAPALTPEILGALIALYEHKVFVQSLIWQINAFDQWGVELGKNLASAIELQLEQSENFSNMTLLDQSTVGLLKTYKTLKIF